MRWRRAKDPAVTTVEAPDLDTTSEAVVRPLRRRPGGLPTHLSLPRQVALIALWPMLEQMMSSLVGFVDMWLTGKLPVEDVASTNAVGVASFVTWLMGLFQGAIGVGSTALVARAIGANHRREANNAVGQSILLAAIWGVAMGFAFYLSANWLGANSGLKGRELELSTMYLRTLAFAAPQMSVLFVGLSCLRGAGDFRWPVAVMAIVNIVNMAVSAWLSIGPADWGGGMALRGIALGTVAAWSVGGVLVLVLLLSKRGGARLMTHRLRFEPRMSWRLMRIGIPSLGENLMMWGAHWWVLIFVGWMNNPNLLGSHSMAIRLEAFSFLPGFACSLAAATLAGQYLGARDPKTATRAVWLCWAYSTAIMTSLGVLFMLVPGFFVSLMTDKKEFTAIVPALLFQAGWSQVGFSTAMVLSGALRGAGDTRMTFYINFVTTVLFRVPACWFVGLKLGYGLEGIWVMLSAELMLKALLFVWRFRHGGWKTIEV